MRPIQDVDVVVLDTDATVTADRGDVVVSGRRVTVSVPGDGSRRPVRLELG